MRLAVDIRCLQDTWRTGVGEYAWRTCQALGSGGDLDLVGYSNAARRAVLPPGLASVFKQVYYGRVPNRLRNLMFSLGVGAALDSEIQTQVGQVDVLWLPVPLFARFSNTLPAVITVHDLSFLYYPEYFRRRGQWWYFPMVKRLLSTLPSSVWVTAVSQHTAQDLVDHFPQLAKRISVVSPGIGPEFLSEPSAALKQEVRAKYNLPARYLLSLGTIEPRKNYLLLLRAYAKVVSRDPLFPYDLVIAGAWGWRTAAFRLELARLSCRQRVHILGYVAASLKAALYAQAALFVYPSFYEGYGIPVLEAMALGVPVIASSSSSLPEVVGSAGLLINPVNESAWVEAITWLGRDASASQSLAEAGKKMARSRTWQLAAQEYHQLFSRLVA